MEKHELVDINGNKTGKILTHIEARDLSKVPYGQYIPVVGIIIVNNENKILMQKRSRLKRTNPNKWGICGGKVDLGETPLDAGIRETLEEIGIKLNKEDLKFLNKYECDKLYFEIYYIKKDVDIDKCKLQKEEVEELRYFSVEEIKYLDTEGTEWLEEIKEVLIRRNMYGN